MHGLADRLAGGSLAVDAALEREFEARLVASSNLAFRVAYGVLRQRQDAEDVAQEAFIKAYRNFHQLRDLNRFRAWLVRMTWRLALDRQRGNRRRAARENRPEAFPIHPGGAADSVASDLESRERAARLWDAIDALPEKLRVVVVLAGIEEHDLGEVAALLGLPEGTVKSRMFLGRQRLKEHLRCTMKNAR